MRHTSGTYGSTDDVLTGQSVDLDYSNNGSCKKISLAMICCMLLVILVSALVSVTLYFGPQWIRGDTADSKKVYYDKRLKGANCTSYVCGVQPTVRSNLKIAGGRTAKPYSWPWQGAVFQVEKGENEKILTYRFLCGATLISDRSAITAAHCINIYNHNNKYVLKLGVFDKQSFEEPGEMLVNADSITIHPLFDTSSMYYDIAIIKFSNEITCSEHIYPICLPIVNEELPPPNSSLTVIGWGKSTGTDTNINIFLKQADLPLISEAICQRIYGPIINHSYNFCAGYNEGGTDSCQGDSGGPIMYKDKNSQWTQLGITSWGYGCALPFRPGVYVRLSTSIQWIQQHLKHKPSIPSVDQQ